VGSLIVRGSRLGVLFGKVIGSPFVYCVRALCGDEGSYQGMCVHVCVGLREHEDERGLLV
jgi:hypothetical protein